MKLLKQQGELLQGIAPALMRREPYNSNDNYECYYCHRRGHFKRAQRHNAENGEATL